MLVANGGKVPFSKRVMIDQAEGLDWIDKLRESIPEEVRTAKLVNSEVEKILEEARHEATTILARAQEQATYLIEERELTRQAEELGREIIRQAEAEALEVKRGADDYAAEVLVTLEGNLLKTMKSVKLGLELLDGRRSTAPETASGADDQGESNEYEQSDARDEAPGRQPIRG